MPRNAIPCTSLQRDGTQKLFQLTAATNSHERKSASHFREAKFDLDSLFLLTPGGSNPHDHKDRRILSDVMGLGGFSGLVLACAALRIFEVRIRVFRNEGKCAKFIGSFENCCHISKIDVDNAG